MRKNDHPLLEFDSKLKFEALKMLYDSQAELLRFISTLDFQIFGGYITLQLGLGSWLAEHRPHTIPQQFGIAIIDGSLALVAVALLHNNYKRRFEVVEALHNINHAFHFHETGAYLSHGSLLPTTQFRPWRKWYFFAIFVAFVGIALLLFIGLSDSQPIKPLDVHLMP